MVSASLESLSHVLLYQDDADSVISGAAYGSQEALNHEWRQPQRKFVDEQDLRLAGQGTGEVYICSCPPDSRPARARSGAPSARERVRWFVHFPAPSEDQVLACG